MKSKIAESLKLKFEPVATLWSDSLPQGAMQFKGVGAGCIMSLFAQVAARGKSAAFSRTTFGCFGGGMGLGFGRQYENFPLGGIEAFKYFLSSGLESSGKREMIEGVEKIRNKEMAEHFLRGEVFKKSPELVEKFLESLPAIDVPAKYVIFKPLSSLSEDEKPVLVTFVANADQISALIALASYGRAGNDNVILPSAAGCHQIGIYAYREAASESQRAVLGLTDLSARKTVRGILGKEVLTFAVPYRMFLEMEGNVEGSFLERSLWSSMAGD